LQTGFEFYKYQHAAPTKSSENIPKISWKFLLGNLYFSYGNKLEYLHCVP